MFQRMREAKERESGFTLIELLIVIIILGVLAAIVVFAVGGITDRGKKTSCSATVRTVDTAAEAYYAQKGTGALTLGGLVSGGFLHPDTNITTGSGVSQPILDSGGNTLYTLTFTPGTATTGGGADGTTCP
jgi:prepilin-type N-terminal cleavage/methylation domain-containing protein